MHRYIEEITALAAATAGAEYNMRKHIDGCASCTSEPSDLCSFGKELYDMWTAAIAEANACIALLVEPSPDTPSDQSE